jgi:signal transduction histidine kinase/CheY-like chemotaxis protein
VLFRELQRSIFIKTDHLFAGLMMFQWAAAIVAAVWIAPRTWAGQYSHIHLHVWVSIFLGGAITLFPVFLVLYKPGETCTRHVIAVSQMLMSALLIDVTGGRMETHFHIFGSFALLAFYRDWRVFIPATLVIGVDHYLRGVYWPQSVFGVMESSYWRWLEHVGWVLFENAFLIYSSLQTERSLKQGAWQRAELEATNELVKQRVRELEEIKVDLSEAKEAAEAGSQAKSTFLATISHELRTPMNGILGMTDLVLDTELTSDQRGSIGILRLSSERLLSVINDILDFSKIEAGKLEFESLPFRLRETVGETMKALGFRAHQKGLELIYEISPDVPDALLGDPRRLRQVLENLTGNAIKFTEHGEILVSVRRGTTISEGAVLHFSIQDTGIGIPIDLQAAIFEPFSQVDGSIARKYGGSGLGLPISRRLAEGLGGTICVESVAGQGSTFHFTTRLEVQPGAPTPVNPHPDQFHGMPALIVDDNPTTRRVLHEVLTGWGMRPSAVKGGREAMSFLTAARDAGQSVPLMLVDGPMPEMDGCTLAQKIQGDSELAGTVGAIIMMLTPADQADATVLSCHPLLSASLTKPIRPSELFKSIARALEARQGPAATQPDGLLISGLHRPRKVLLVDDNRVNQTLALRLLEKQGCTVSLAGNGQAALDALERDCFEVVLMDIQMPIMDGFAATGEIRKKELLSGDHLPIIAITAHVMNGDQEQCLDRGMDGYVCKPICASDLFATIESVIARFPARPGAVLRPQLLPIPDRQPR